MRVSLTNLVGWSIYDSYDDGVLFTRSYMLLRVIHTALHDILPLQATSVIIGA